MRDTRLVLLIGLLVTPLSARAATVVDALGDASITHDSQTATWRIGAAGATLAVVAGTSRDFQVVDLVSPSGDKWITRGTAGTTVTVNGSRLAFGSAAAGFEYEHTATSNDGHVLRLDTAFLLRSAGLLITRHMAVAAGSPTFEMWTTFQSSSGRTSAVSDLNAFELVTPAGTVHWLTGHQGDGSDDSPFDRREQVVAAGQTWTLGAVGRSSEQAVPWMAVDGTQDEWYAGLMWSGAWSLVATGTTPGMVLSMGLAPMSTLVGATPVEGPHAIVGVARGGLPEAAAALRSYVFSGVRAGRPLTPLVTYNTWFAYGTNVGDASMRAEMAHAAAIGTELFVLDAGWYAGADTADPSDFDAGLGSWTADAARFPNGLKALTDYAHSLGMKFGLWVEPERVNLSVVDEGEVDEAWLATAGGTYGSDHMAQVCLAGAAGRQWVLDRLFDVLDTVQPDYLKWDSNMWVNCDRAGHDHGTRDGNFAHVTALYEILDALRQRYPNLLIENCSSGANRIDFGMLRYTDAAWMDDHTAPSAHVRHNLEGLSAAFPPAYLLSFVTDHLGEPVPEPLHDAPDLALYFRSRMGGALGLCFRSEAFSDDDLLNMSRQIAIYKAVRAMVSDAAGALLTPQARVSDGPDWDVLQATAPGSVALIVYAYQDNAGADTVNVKPTDLQPEAVYVVQSVDAGVLGTATGADLMADGIDVVASPESAAHILTLEREP